MPTSTIGYIPRVREMLPRAPQRPFRRSRGWRKHVRRVKAAGRKGRG